MRIFGDRSQQISSSLALLLIVILAVLVGYMALTTGEMIIRNIRESPVIQMNEALTLAHQTSLRC